MTSYFSARRIAALFCCAALSTGLAICQEHPSQEHQQPSASSKPASPTADWHPEALPPLPPDASVPQTINVSGDTLHYTAMVGTIPVYNITDPAKPEAKPARSCSRPTL